MESAAPNFPPRLTQPPYCHRNVIKIVIAAAGLQHPELSLFWNISLPVHWQFSYYKPLLGESDVRSAFDAGSAELKAKFMSQLRILNSRPHAEWKRPLVGMLEGECDGLVEIRFKADRKQQRPLGVFNGQGQFVILFWAIEKGGKFVPKSACQTAKKRASEIQEKKELVDAIWFALE